MPQQLSPDGVDDECNDANDDDDQCQRGMGRRLAECAEDVIDHGESWCATGHLNHAVPQQLSQRFGMQVVARLVVRLMVVAVLRHQLGGTMQPPMQDLVFQLVHAGDYS